MTAKEKNKYIKEFKEYRKDVTSSREKAEKFMIESGIHNKNGKLNNSYK